MKVTRKTLFSLILAFAMLLASITWLGSVGTEKADATIQNDVAIQGDAALKSNNTNATLYYFSDSTPYFSDVITADTVYCNYVYYDVHPLITEQELAFLIYSGYFWGFNETTITTVIIEIKTMKPDQDLLEQLFKCIESQQRKVLFICPYIYSMGYDVGTGEGSFTAMPCNFDRYSVFIDHSIRYMNDADVGNTLSPSTIFIDGRLFGLDSIQEEYNLLDYWASSTVRRIFYDIAYNVIDDDSEKPIPDGNIFEKLWTYYCKSDFIDSATGGCTLKYFDDFPDIDDYIKMWEKIEQTVGYYGNGYGYSGSAYEQLELFKEEMTNAFKGFVGEYYKELLVKYFSNENNEKIHILAHVAGNEYIDLTKYLDSDNSTEDSLTDESNFFKADVYNFSTLNEFFDVAEMNQFNLKNIYAIGIYRLKSDFYNFLKKLQDYRDDFYMDLPILLWRVDSCVEGEDDGLRVILDDEIINYYEDDFPFFDEDWLKELFKKTLQNL
jgi:hypothetical protein